MNNAERRDLLDQTKQAQAQGFTGSVIDVFNNPMALQEFNLQQQAQQPRVEMANTPQQRQQGLRGRSLQDSPDKMVFPNTPPNTPFNTVGMKFPIDIEKRDNQGHLVESYKNVPPGIKSLPTGPAEGTIIESPSQKRDGGPVKNQYQKGGFAAQSGLSEDEYSTRFNAALEKYGDDVALAFDPNTGNFAPGNQMLPTAEVVGDIDLRGKTEQDIYRNLGASGVFDYRKVRKNMHTAGKNFLKPVANTAMHAANMVPIVGEVMDAGSVARGYAEGKDIFGNATSGNTEAGLLGAGLLIPNIIEKPARALYRGAKGLFKAGAKKTPQLTNSITQTAKQVGQTADAAPKFHFTDKAPGNFGEIGDTESFNTVVNQTAKNIRERGDRLFARGFDASSLTPDHLRYKGETNGRHLMEVSLGDESQHFYLSTGLGGKKSQGVTSKGMWVPYEGRMTIKPGLLKNYPKGIKDWVVKTEGWDYGYGSVPIKSIGDRIGELQPELTKSIINKYRTGGKYFPNRRRVVYNKSRYKK